MKKALWNTLPAKPEDIKRIASIISKGPIRPKDLIIKSGLSKTRCLSAVDDLIYNKKILEIQGVIHLANN